MKKHVNILGIRGLPAAHGGFETFAHHFALWLQKHGWDVLVYCQHDDNNPLAPRDEYQDEWHGIKRVHFRVPGNGPLSTIRFDYRCVRDVMKRPGIDLVLGYNTAIFSVLQRMNGRTIIMNMDGIEWKRDKWGIGAKAWFWVNELIGAHICHYPIADHPQIAAHLKRHRTKNISIIPYGAASITEADEAAILALGLQPASYIVSIARIEPENSVYEIVRTFSLRRRGVKLVVLGNLTDENPYHRKVQAAASPEIVFAGAIFEERVVNALRFFARAYIHGHQVGGTNPSLVEALGAGNPVIAHDNVFNRWVAGSKQMYFKDEKSLDDCINLVISSSENNAILSLNSAERHNELFTMERVHNLYHDLLLRASKPDLNNV